MRESTKWRVPALLIFLLITGIVAYGVCYFYGTDLGWVTTKEKIGLWVLIMVLVMILLMLINFGVSAHQKGIQFLDNNNAEPSSDKKNK